MPSARMALAELAPMTQRSASKRLALPQPFGPTTPVRPGSILNSVGSTKDLKPERRSRWKRMAASRAGSSALGEQRRDRAVEVGHGRFAISGFQLLAVDQEGGGLVNVVHLFGVLLAFGHPLQGR